MPGARSWHRGWRVLGVARKAAIGGLGPQPTATHYGFTTLKPTPYNSTAKYSPWTHTQVTINIAPQALATLTSAKPSRTGPRQRRRTLVSRLRRPLGWALPCPAGSCSHRLCGPDLGHSSRFQAGAGR